MDNLKQVESNIEQFIDENGSAGSILAENHKIIELGLLKKVGKYTGFPFLAKKSRSIFTPGLMSFESNSFNSGSFNLKFSKKTADLNSFANVLSLLNPGALIHYKDFVGRSQFFKFNSYSEGQDGNSNDICTINVEAYPENSNYTFQDAEEEVCVFSFVNKAGTSSGGGGGNVDSVNGETGVVNLDATEIPFDSSGLTLITTDDVEAAVSELELVVLQNQTAIEELENSKATKYEVVVIDNALSSVVLPSYHNKLLYIKGNKTIVFDSAQNYPANFNFNYKIAGGRTFTIQKGDLSMRDGFFVSQNEMVIPEYTYGMCYKLENDFIIEI